MRRWPHVRAGLVALAMVVGLADGCPLPTVSRAPEPLQGAIRQVKTVRRVALTPFRPIGELFLLRQRWKLFPTADRDQMLMSVEARSTATGEWEVLYRPNDATLDLMADRIEYRRLRAAWNPGSRGKRNGYRPFVQWLAGELFAQRPDIDQVRVRMEKIRIEPEQGAFVGSGEYVHQVVERRRGQRPEVHP